MTKRHSPRLPFLVASLVLAGICAASAASRVPVIVGAEQGVDACGATAMVTGLDPNGDGFLAVRTGPGAKYAKIDQLKNGRQFNWCDERFERQGRHGWIGIVYGPGKGSDCKTESPKNPREYTGPCKYGWVSLKYVVVVAG